MRRRRDEPRNPPTMETRRDPATLRIALELLGLDAGEVAEILRREREQSGLQRKGGPRGRGLKQRFP